jgi:2-(1,2-epoxy-1,2-dihydrophenyl)acetyl-CoA isomerase
MSNPQATSTEPLLIDRDGPIATLTLNRPDTGNAINMDLGKALMHAAISCDEDPSVRCVILRGNGQRFCVGGDLTSFAASGQSIGASLKELTAYLHSAIARLARMEKPLITVIQGAAAGAGLSLAALGDIALAARSAQFTPAYTAVGLTPDGGLTWLLPRLVGLRLAQELILENRRLTAAEAAELGLVSRVVADEELTAHSRQVAERLARSATSAIADVRRLLLSAAHSSLETQMEYEARSIANAARHAHGREGISAFLDKRKPNFS